MMAGHGESQGHRIRLTGLGYFQESHKLKNRSDDRLFYNQNFHEMDEKPLSSKELQ